LRDRVHFDFTGRNHAANHFVKRGTNEINQSRFSAVFFVSGHNGSIISGGGLVIR
jgi:hypothetical protein